MNELSDLAGNATVAFKYERVIKDRAYYSQST